MVAGTAGRVPARISHHGHGLRRGVRGVARSGRKAYRGIRLRPATPRAGAWARPEGRRSPPDSVRHGASPMHHIAVRAVPTLSAGERRADLDPGENCGLEPATRGWQRAAHGLGLTLLGFDTATPACSAALWAHGEVTAWRRIETGGRHAEALVPMLRAVAAEGGIPLAAVDRFAVTVGPGSFTGIRIGLATARGLALASDRPLIGLSTLEVLAAGVPDAERDGPVLAALDAGRGRLYAQLFDRSLSAILEPRALHAAALPDLVTEAKAGGPLIVAGTGTGGCACGVGARRSTRARRRARPRPMPACWYTAPPPAPKQEAVKSLPCGRSICVKPAHGRGSAPTENRCMGERPNVAAAPIRAIRAGDLAFR